MASFFVLLGMIAFGISNVIWKPLLPRLHISTLLFRRSCWSAILIAVLYIAGRSICLRPEWYHQLVKSESASSGIVTYLISAGCILVSLLGLYLFILSLKHQPAGISGMIVCTSTLLSALLGWILLQEPLHPTLLLSLTVSLAGVLLMDRTKLQTFSINRGVALALLGAGCWGIANIGFKKMIPQTGVLQFSLLQESSVVLVSAIGIRRSVRTDKHPTLKIQPSDHLLVFLISLCTIIGVVFCNLGMKDLPISRFALLVLAQPLCTFLFAAVWLKEKTTWTQKAGALLILVGIYTGIVF